MRRLILPMVFALVVTGCTVAAAPPKDPIDETAVAAVIEEFATDWADGRSQDASRLTSDPAASAILMTEASEGLGASDLAIDTGPLRVRDDIVEVTATLTWQTPEIGEWSYQVPWTWRRRGSGPDATWLLDFAPQSVHPRLGPGQHLAVRTEPAVNGPIVDRNDIILISDVRVYSVVLLLDKLADVAATAQALAAVLEPIDADLTAEAISADITSARRDGEASYTVINLREEDFGPIEGALTRIPGVTLPSQVRALPPTAGFAQTLLRTALPVAEATTIGRGGWRIVTVDGSGGELTTLAEQRSEPGPKAMLTIDQAIQNAAQAAVDAVPEQTMLVAIEPSTGEILAVAQNAAADAEGPIALMGRYPPGSIFKIVTATAGLDAGLITPASMVGCPGAWSADGKTIRNDGFSLGTVTATTAFAHSCNTTFAELATRLGDDALPETALQYGIGVDFDIAGITTLTGAIQTAPTLLQKAQNGFGQGTDLVTPFGAALMAATAATGNMPVPTLIRGIDTVVDRPVTPRSEAAQAALKAMMRAVVTEGTARQLQSLGDVGAKTGTAEFVAADGEIAAHAWTVGFRDDLAFAVLIVAGNTSSRSNEVARSFLSAVPDGEPAEG